MSAATERTPVLSKQASKEQPADPNGEKNDFRNTFGIVMSCLGCAVGTGNVWRFPRIVALNAGNNGALCFLLPWIMFLFLWSIPMTLIEYSAGRYTKKGVVGTMQYFAGLKATWCGFWIALVNFFIAAWYHVVAGWCLYYFVQAIAYPLPDNHLDSSNVFYNFTEHSYWSVLTQGISIAVAALFLLRGGRSIETGNLFFVPLMLVLILVIFIWSVTRPGALAGLRFFFTPDWQTLATSRVWVDAITQNSFDTGAGWGQFLTYASFMAVSEPIVKYSSLIPLANNVVSLMCGMMTFTIAFSSLNEVTPNITDSEIVGILQSSGPASTGLGFIWFPVLFGSAGVAGRVCAAAFFICLVFASLSSLLSQLEVVVRFLEDFRLPRKYGLPAVVIVCFLLGLGSSLNLTVLANQDYTWGYALLLSGLFLLFMVIKFGTSTFREHVINITSDWHVPIIWEWMVKVLLPIEGIFLLGWWIAHSIWSDSTHKEGYHWYEFGTHSLMTALIQWIVLLLILVVINVVLLWLKPDWFMKVTWSARAERLEEDDARVNTDGGPGESSSSSADSIELTGTK